MENIQTNVNNNSFVIGDQMKAGWAMFKTHWQKLLWALFAYVVASLPLGIVDGIWNLRLYTEQPVWSEMLQREVMEPVWIAGTSETVLYALFFIVSLIWSIIIGYNWYKSFFTVYDQNQYNFKDMFVIPSGEEANVFFKYLGAYICYGLMVLVGLILLIVPGIYLAIRYGFAINLVVDKKMGIKEAFAMSSKMTEGIKWKLIGLGLLQLVVCIGIFLVGLIALIVGVIPAAFIAFGWTLLTTLILYRHLYEVNK